MSIKREDLDAGRVDFSDVIDREGEPIGPIHPGTLLREEWLEPLGLGPERLAGDLGIPAARIAALLAGGSGIDADLALRLARYFGTDAQSWMNLQVQYDLAVAHATLAGRLEAEVKPRAA